MTTSQRVGSYQRHGLLPRVLLGLTGLSMMQYAADLFVSPAIRGMSSGRDYARVRMRESLSFGKYAGQSFKEIAETDPDYCSWVLGQAEDPDANPSMLEFATFLGESYPDIQAAASSQPSASYDLDDNIVRFGKHADKEYSDLIMEDPQYCGWVLSQLDDPEASDQVQHFAQWLDGNKDVLEDALAMSPASGPTATVSFGKHKGQTYQWLLENEPDYCRFVMDNMEPGPHSASLIEWLQTQEIPEAPAGGPTGKVAFGKHKGQTYQWLLENEPDYCRYIIDVMGMDAGPRSAPLIEWLQTQEIPEAPVGGGGGGHGGAPGIVTFGKHKGKSYEAVLEEDIQYCQWMLERLQNGEELTGGMKVFADWVYERAVAQQEAEVGEES